MDFKIDKSFNDKKSDNKKIINVSKKTTIPALLFFLLFGLLIFWSFRTGKNKNKLINDNKIETIGKVYEIVSGRSFTSANYFYYFNDEKFYSNEYIHNSGKQYINNYYRIDLSSVEPKFSIIYFNDKVTDSVKIIQAGFKP